MEIYLVGGAIRDELLGREIKERDWVVIGATPREMLQAGFKPVGKDFPVFLHPKTGEEYALARTERKISKGYKGFKFYTTPEITLKEDLVRRDLTINAIAKDKEGKLIDPCGGQKDLKAKLLHHISLAFQEDPVRILRVARFAAKLPDFKIHPKTLALMQKMVKLGEVDALVAERVWQEFIRALAEESPQRFFDVLNECHALPILFPEIKPLKERMRQLKVATKATVSTIVRFALLFFSLSVNEIETFCKRYRVPNQYKDLTKLVTKNYKSYLNIKKPDASFILKFLTIVDAFRRPKRFKKFLQTCALISKEIDSKKINSYLMDALKAAKSVNTGPLLAKGLKGLEFAKMLKEKREKAIEAVLKN